MTSDDELIFALRKTTLNDSKTQHTSLSSPSKDAQPKSFLHAMNEKLAQRPRKPRTRGRGNHYNNHNQASTRPSTRIPPAPKPDPSTLFTLSFKDDFLGVFSTFERALSTAGLFGWTEKSAIRWGDDGFREFPGTLKILPYKVSRPQSTDDEKEDGPEPEPEPERTLASGDSTEGEIQAPTPQVSDAWLEDVKTVYVAFNGTLFLGVFVTKSSAWEACMKHKKQITYSVQLADEERWIDRDGLPHLAGKLEGNGWHVWHVRMCKVDVVEKWKRRDS